jgi:hypothetical protein
MVRRERLRQSPSRAAGSDCVPWRSGVGLRRRAPGAPDRLPRRVRTMTRRHCRYRFRSHGSREARAGSIPAYIPVLIALSFAQYALDSVVILGSATPVATRLGHWGGVINFVLVITLACAPPPRLPERLVRQADAPHRDSLSRRDHRPRAQPRAVARHSPFDVIFH